jgi:hypothetical protein
MLGVTIFGIFFTPVFYSVIRWFTSRKGEATKTPNGPGRDGVHEETRGLTPAIATNILSTEPRNPGLPH